MKLKLESETMSLKPRVFLRYTAPSRGIRENTRSKRLMKPRNLAWEHNSIYYFYFAFLKRNKEFEKIYKNGGKTRNKLHKQMYNDFVNIYKVETADDFYKWFNEVVNTKNSERRGYYLFAEENEKATEEVTEIAQLNDTDNSLVVKIDLRNTNSYIGSSIRELLKKNAAKVDRARKQSTARYKVAEGRTINTLFQSLQVYDYKMNNANKKDNETICSELGININDEDLRGAISALQKATNRKIYQQRCGKALSRYKAQAEKYIKSALSDNFLSKI